MIAEEKQSYGKINRETVLTVAITIALSFGGATWWAGSFSAKVETHLKVVNKQIEVATVQLVSMADEIKNLREEMIRLETKRTMNADLIKMLFDRLDKMEGVVERYHQPGKR